MGIFGKKKKEITFTGPVMAEKKTQRHPKPCLFLVYFVCVCVKGYERSDVSFRFSEDSLVSDAPELISGIDKDEYCLICPSQCSCQFP